MIKPDLMTTACGTHHIEDSSRYPDPKINLNGEYMDTKGKYGPDIWADFICDYVSQEHEKPFFLYYPMALPHNPFSPTPDSPEWKDASKRYDEENHFYGDMVEYTDNVLGRIVAAIDEAGIGKDTLLIFYSDNGTNQKIETETAWG